MKTWYSKSYRRLILDMHIADWDPGFMAAFDPKAIAKACEQARLDSFMLYAISHVGLCYWPAKHGKMHTGLNGRDLVGEMIRELKAGGIATCGYISVIFDNWAFLEHPNWRQQPAKAGTAKSGDKPFPGGRYGLVCPNNPEYRAYIMAQVDDLYGQYDFDGAYFDMTYWPTVCQCPHCRQRLESEAGIPIPQTVDWFNPDWCAFQTARERWLEEFAGALAGRTKAARPGISVHHNFATLQHDWRSGVSCRAALTSDFLGADFYGDALEQLLVCKLYQKLSADQPIEFTTTCCPTPGYHEQLKSAAQMEMHVLGATLASAAFMWIDAVDLDGAINPAVCARIGDVFEKTSAYQPYLGGEAVEDVAIYFSDASKMDFRGNGVPVVEAKGTGPKYPHMLAARGWARVLQKAHVPFGVITRKDADVLDRYRLVILPNVLRMDEDEVAALREYVRRGGRVYASRYTSLTETSGVRHKDFMLADVFGCHCAADDLGTVTYVKPADESLARAIAPQAYLDHFAPTGTPADGAGAVRLREQADGRPLATLTLPYHKEWGDVFNHKWGSIHSSPPWQDTAAPAIVMHDFGAGRCIYSAADIESIPSDANEATMRHLLDLLLDGPMSFSADTHPCVWTSVFHQPELRRYRVCFLNCQEMLPPVPIDAIKFSLRPPAGHTFTKLVAVPDEKQIEFRSDDDGILHAELERLEVFGMLLACYQ